MSYIQTVTIMKNISKSYIEANLATVYETIYNKIASVTGWETSASGLLVGTGSKQLRINISYLASDSEFNYTVYSQNDNGNVTLGRKFFNTYMNSTYNLYLHYCKSKSGKTIGIGISIDSTPTIEFIIAEDVNGDFSAIDLNMGDSNNYAAQMIWNGYKCNLGPDNGYRNYSGLRPVIDTRLSTSICKMPHFLANCMFKELYMILSLPIKLSLLNGVVLDIEGKKYQGCYAYYINNTSSYEDFNTLAILAE